MANVNLTPDMITREALRVLHQNCNFIGNINREYDDSFAESGAKIGNTLRVRQPIQYSTGTGATMATGTGADSIGASTTLTVNSQRHVPMRFTSNELTMSIDDFSERHIKPAMAKLAAMIEADCLSQACAGASNWVNAGTKVEYADVQSARVDLQQALAPPDGRAAVLNPQAMADLVNDNKSLFNDTKEVGKQYREGMMGRFNGFDFYENTVLPSITNAAGGSTSYDVASDAQEKTLSSTSSDPYNQTLSIDTGTKAIALGAKFTIADIYDVHPETKESTGALKVFTVTGGDTGTATATSITISPAIIVSGPHQNCIGAAGATADPSDGDTITVLGDTTANNQSILFQKGFATFATADLYLPKGTDMASRQVYDGISMRMVRDFDVVKDRLYTRLDVLYGFKVLRPQLGAVIVDD